MIKDLLNDNLINKEILILKRYKFLNIDQQQAKLISKILKSKKIDLNFISISEISEILKTSDETSKKIIESLIKDEYIKIIVNNNELKFNFNFLVKKLLETYLPPTKNSTLKNKLQWIESTLNINSEIDNISYIKNFMRDSDWEKLLIIINKIYQSKIKKINWSMIVTSYETFNKNSKNENKVKKIMDSNWLKS